MFQTRISHSVAEFAPRLHLGAHKTATTWIQHMIAKNARMFAEKGVVSLCPDDLRKLPSSAYGIGGAMDPVSRMLRISKARAAFETVIRSSGGLTARRLILSEENMAGSCAEIIREKALYPTLSARLKVLPRSFGKPEAVIFFAVREYGRFFASCHSQVARNRRKMPLLHIDRTSLLRLPRRWPRIISEIRAAFPSARLIVWRYEDFSSLQPRIIQHLTGFAPGQVRLPKEHPLPALSHEAMIRLMREEAETGKPIGEHTLARLISELSVENGARRYNPWTEEEAFLLRFSYAQDWSAIRALPGVDVLEQRDTCNDEAFG